MQSVEDTRNCPMCKRDFVVTVYDRPGRCPHCQKFLLINHTYRVSVTVGGVQFDVGFEKRELEAFCDILLPKGLSSAGILGTVLKLLGR